jgi:transposase
MATETEKWSSIEEIAEHTQVHKDTIRLWIKKGEIPAYEGWNIMEVQNKATHGGVM